MGSKPKTPFRGRGVGNFLEHHNVKIQQIHEKLIINKQVEIHCLIMVTPVELNFLNLVRCLTDGI